MSGAAKITRRFWRIHLSTAVLLMVIAGGLIHLNLTPNDQMNHCADYGWPIGYAYLYVGYQPSMSEFNPVVAALDAVFAIFLISFFYICIEIAIRDREGRKA